MERRIRTRPERRKLLARVPRAGEESPEPQPRPPIRLDAVSRQTFQGVGYRACGGLLALVCRVHVGWTPVVLDPADPTGNCRKAGGQVSTMRRANSVCRHGHPLIPWVRHD